MSKYSNKNVANLATFLLQLRNKIATNFTKFVDKKITQSFDTVNVIKTTNSVTNYCDNS